MAPGFTIQAIKHMPAVRCQNVAQTHLDQEGLAVLELLGLEIVLARRGVAVMAALDCAPDRDLLALRGEASWS